MRKTAGASEPGMPTPSTTPTPMPKPTPTTTPTSKPNRTEGKDNCKVQGYEGKNVSSSLSTMPRRGLGPFRMDANYGFPITDARLGARLKALHGVEGDKTWRMVTDLLSYRAVMDSKRRPRQGPAERKEGGVDTSANAAPPNSPPAPHTSPPDTPACDGKGLDSDDPTRLDTMASAAAASYERKVWRRPRKRSMSWTGGIPQPRDDEVSERNSGEEAGPSAAEDCAGLDSLRSAKSDTAAQRPPHAGRGSKMMRYLKGLGRGIVGVPLGVVKGVSGVVLEPVHGARSGEPMGFLRGAGNALTGVVKAPLQAVADLADSAAGEKKRRRSVKIGSVKSYPGRELLLGAAGLGKGVFRGAFGVLIEPVRMAHREGVKGFFKGIGKGIVGTVGQPIKGVVRFIEGIERSFASKLRGCRFRLGSAHFYLRVIHYGIPSSLRPAVWDVASGARDLRERHGGKFFAERVRECQGMFSIFDEATESLTEAPDKELQTTELGELLVDCAKQHPGMLSPAEWTILKDLDRTFPEHKGIANISGLRSLAEILGAFARYSPDVGYCQGINYLASILLLVTGTEEAAFWLLVALTENILPRNYFDGKLSRARADASLLRDLAVRLHRKAVTHLDSSGVPLEACVLPWYISMFSNALPVHTVVRIWDLLFLRGRAVLHEVALALIGINRSKILSEKDPGRLFNLVGGLAGQSGRDDAKLLKKASDYLIDSETLDMLFVEELQRQEAEESA